MVITQRYGNKALVVNIPLRSHFIKRLVLILYTHPFLCSGKHTHPEVLLLLSPYSVYTIKSVNLTQRLLSFLTSHGTAML